MVCESARTSVKAVLMSMAMASIMKVFPIRKKKEGKGYNATQKGQGRREKKRSGVNAGEVKE